MNLKNYNDIDPINLRRKGKGVTRKGNGSGVTRKRNGGNILAEGLGPWASYVGAKVSEQGRGPVWFVVLMNSDLC